jgi:hypothetical protein
MRLLLAVAASAVLAVVARGGDDDEVTSPTPVATNVVAVTPSPTPERRDPCSLLSVENVVAILGQNPGRVVPHHGPGSLNFCTIYLEIGGCEGQCALSLDNLGAVSENSNNTPDRFRQNLETANPDATATFQDGVLGADSWLANFTTTDLPEWKVLYFQVSGIAYNLSGPHVPDYSPTNDQMIALGQAVIDNLQ